MSGVSDKISKAKWKETDAKWKAQFSVTTQAWRKLLCFLGACRLHKQKGESSDLSPYNISLTKLVWSRWLDSAQHFFRFMDLDFVLVHKRANIELGQYQAIFLTSRSGNSSYKATVQKWRRTGFLLEHTMHVLNPKVTRVFTSELNDISGWWLNLCIPYSVCLLSKSGRLLVLYHVSVRVWFN